jgi:sulfate adenylyltransferase
LATQLNDPITTIPTPLNPPYGGMLVDLLAPPKRAFELRAASREWPSWDLSARQLCDLELLLNGAFSPLHGFMDQPDYEGVCRKMRLQNGSLWPIPIVLDVPSDFAELLRPDQSHIALRDQEGVMLAVLHVGRVWQPDRTGEAEAVFGTCDPEHPGVAYLLQKTHPCYVGGRLEGVQLPSHYDSQQLRLTPAQLRAEFSREGWSRVVAFQTRNPMHRAHFELTCRAASNNDAKLLIHPVVGMTKPGDVDHYTRVRCYRALLHHYPANSAKLALLPLAMRMGGPREVLLHAIIRTNFGCTHLIVGRDHAGPGCDSSGKRFYDAYAAQEAFREHEEELGIRMLPFQMMVYLSNGACYVPEDEVPKGKTVSNISGTELRQLLAEGKGIPSWFTFPEVEAELRRSYPQRQRQGCTVFFTGLSGAGKSTIAKALMVKLLEMGGRTVTLLDGDLVRKHLSSELGFSREHRDLNISRIGYVASEITKHGGIAICAPIAPYDRIRKEVRNIVTSCGGFVLVHVSAPLSVCEERDHKGLYAKARAGIIQHFTGISDPYEIPDDAELMIDTTNTTPQQAVRQILLHLQREGFVQLSHREFVGAA